MKKLFTASTILCILFCHASQAQFTGCYAAANWTVNNTNTNGSLYSTTNYFDIIADTDQNGNNVQGVDCSTTNNGNVSVCISIPASGQIMFSWYWTGGNNATLLTEPFGYCINNVATDLTNNTTYSGTQTVNVTSGDNFCFVLSSQFSNSHPTLFTHININTFSRPCVTTSVNNISGQEIFTASFVENNLNVSGTNEGGILHLFDVSGKKVMQQKSTNTSTILNTAFLSRGFYIVSYSEKNKIQYARVMKY